MKNAVMISNVSINFPPWSTVYSSLLKLSQYCEDFSFFLFFFNDKEHRQIFYFAREKKYSQNVIANFLHFTAVVGKTDDTINHPAFKKKKKKKKKKPIGGIPVPRATMLDARKSSMSERTISFV